MRYTRPFIQEVVALARLCVLLAVVLPLLLSTQASAKKPAARPRTPKVIECGKDLSCLSDAAVKCSPARATHETVVDLMGMEERSKDRYELKGWDGNRCIVLRTKLEASVKIGPKVRQAARAKGMSTAELDQAQAEGKKEREAEIGKTRECKAPPMALERAFRRWKKGQYQTGDLGECGEAR